MTRVWDLYLDMPLVWAGDSMDILDAPLEMQTRDGCVSSCRLEMGVSLFSSVTEVGQIDKTPHFCTYPAREWPTDNIDLQEEKRIYLGFGGCYPE